MGTLHVLHGVETDKDGEIYAVIDGKRISPHLTHEYAMQKVRRILRQRAKAAPKVDSREETE